jgi:hypothetical protein
MSAPTSPYASVIVPTHDRAATLDLSVRSIQQQTVPNLEIVIVGDGVTGEVRDVARGLASADSRIAFHDWPKAPERGGENRDRAVNAAKSDRIFYNDDDDLFFPDHVARLGPHLDDCDAVNDATGSVSLSGILQVSIANHGRGPIREALTAGTAKVLFDTHFAHRRSTYQRLRAPWTRAGRQPVLNLFQAFAADTSVKWRSLAGVTALSFHGAARQQLSQQERRAELELWYPLLAQGFSRALAPAAYYDWYVFKLATALNADLSGGIEPFLASCHTRLDTMPESGEADLVVSLVDDQIESLRNACSLLRGERIDSKIAAELVVRLADPLISQRLNHQLAVRLASVIGSAQAIEAVRDYQPTDPYSQEIRAYLLSALLLADNRLREAEAELQGTIGSSRYFIGELLTQAARLARRQENPARALEFANAAIAADCKIRNAHNICVWALLQLRRAEAAREATERAKSLFPEQVS